MNELQIFENKEFGSVRTLMIDDDPWFVGKDVASVLAYCNTRDALARHVDDEDKGVAKCDTPGGKQDLIIINESGLYSLILSSKLPGAKRFKHWVTSEVLPALRKTGAYAPDQPPSPVERRVLTTDDYIKAAQIVAGCKNERLPYVIHLLKKGGFEFPLSAKPVRELTEDNLVGMSVSDAYREFGCGIPMMEFEDSMKCAFNLTVIIRPGSTGRRLYRIFEKEGDDNEV